MKRHLAFALAAVLFPAVASAQRQVDFDGIPTISTSASADVKVAPDQVYLSLGVTVRDRSLESAKEQSDARVAAVLKSLQENGIADKDMQTDYVSIQPNYENAVVATPDVYVVARSIGVRLRDVSKFEKVLTDVIKSGANQVGGIDFRTSDLQKHRNEARKLAILAARDKAQTLAAALDAKLGKVQAISENANNFYVGSSSGCFAAQNAVLNSADSGPMSDTLATGQINVSATVNVTFRLE